MLPQPKLTAERLAREVQALVSDPARLKQMGEHARTLGVPDAAERIVAVLAEFCKGAGRRPRRSKRSAQPSHRGRERQWDLPTATSSA